MSDAGQKRATAALDKAEQEARLEDGREFRSMTKAAEPLMEREFVQAEVMRALVAQFGEERAQALFVQLSMTRWDAFFASALNASRSAGTDLGPNTNGGASMLLKAIEWADAMVAVAKERSK